MKPFQPVRRIVLALAASLLVAPAWGQGTAKPGVLTVGLGAVTGCLAGADFAVARPASDEGTELAVVAVTGT